MDCRESRDLMSGAVDNQLYSHESANFYKHIEICGSCKDEFELEKLIKAYIRRKLTLVDVPPDLEQAIMKQLSRIPISGQREGIVAGLMGNRIFQPILAVGIVFLVGVALFFANRPNLIVPSITHNNISAVQPTYEDVLSFAMNNFQDIISGKFKPQVTAIQATDVASYLNQNGYSFPLPSVSSADWVGGTISNYNGNKMAQVIYKMGEQYIYICGFPKRVFNLEENLLPQSCAKAVADNKWFWGQDANGDTQAAWSSGDQVCVATSNLDKNALATFLKPLSSTVGNTH
jgi:anti-sigma factor (TIGR02949 family)